MSNQTTVRTTYPKSISIGTFHAYMEPVKATLLENGFYLVKDTHYWILEHDRDILDRIITELMEKCCGLQFSCGTMVFKNPDASILFIIPEEILAKYRAIKPKQELIGWQRDGDNWRKPQFYTIIKMELDATVPEQHKCREHLLTFIADWQRKKAEISLRTPPNQQMHG